MTGPAAAVRTRNAVVALAIVVLLGALLLLWKGEEWFGAGRQATPAGAVSRPAERAADTGPPTPPESVAETWPGWVGSPPQWPLDLGRPDCAEVDREVETLCRSLDDRPELRVAGEGSPCEFLRQAARDLAARPPAVSGEIGAVSMVDNVFHLFRVLGRDRIRLLRPLVTEKADLAEPAALVLYRWWIGREACGGGEWGEIGLESFYDYAAFAFQTMGGQAYLRRRAPRIEALACFYGLEGVDLADTRGHNPFGVDLSPEIARCSALVETQGFVWTDRYRRELERIANRWRARRPS